ncbi:putative Poxvirus related late transcription factor VLTF3 [Organic Lake phycodnavirus 1]|jgi:hypothetical protein|nr:putative Poxvirus related late transcription factor VLTF3 [Organic Lake phycodnavirus 1]
MKELTIDNLYTNYLNDINQAEYKILNNKQENSELQKDEQQRLYRLKKKKNDYLLNNSNDLFNYFECKQKIEINQNPKKMIQRFFNQQEDDSINILNKSIQNYIKKNNFSSMNISDFMFDNSVCSKCSKGEMIKIISEGILLCNNCFNNETFFVENDKPSYRDPPKEISFYAYKRINHFREILSQFQAKESTDIPHEIISQIENQVKKERIELSELTNKKTKEILKKLGYNKYYEHIPFIKDRLGIKPPVMSPKLEETLCNLFMDIQIPYSKYCPNDRVNFLNYYYTLYKLCELLGETSYLKHFPMLKEQKKVEQDEIWKNICRELDWEFISTL